MPKTINDIIIKIPAKIRKIAKEHKLNRSDIEVLSQLDYLNNSNGCTITNRTLSVYIDKSIPTVQRIIAKLIKLGLVVSNIVDHYQRTLRTTFEKVSQKLVEAVENIKDNLSQNEVGVYHNNTTHYNKKQFKSFYKKEEKRKLELNMYQQSSESISEFDKRCVEREAIGNVIIRKIHIQKVKSTSKLNAFELMKNAYKQVKCTINI